MNVLLAIMPDGRVRAACRDPRYRLKGQAPESAASWGVERFERVRAKLMSRYKAMRLPPPVIVIVRVHAGDQDAPAPQKDAS